MSGDCVLLPYFGTGWLDDGQEELLTWTEPLVRWVASATVLGRSTLDDGSVLPRMVGMLERSLRDGLEREHRVAYAEFTVDEEYDAMSDELRLRVWAMTHRDLDWLGEILADARRAVEEDRRWFASLADGRVAG